MPKPLLAGRRQLCHGGSDRDQSSGGAGIDCACQKRPQHPAAKKRRQYSGDRAYRQFVERDEWRLDDYLAGRC